MSDPAKTKVNTEEKSNENSDESDYLWSDEEEEGEIREIVLALPALSLLASPDVDEATRQKAVAAADLLIAAAQEAVVTKGNVEQGVGGSGETGKKKKTRPRMVNLDDLADVAGASGSKATVPAGEEEPAKKPRKKGSSKLINPPDGPPKCNICDKSFLSWKAVFGHLRAHSDRGYHGYFPPPKFNAAVEVSGGDVAASSGGGGFGLGTGGLKIDLNDDPIDVEETGTGSGPKFDLNMSPPQDEGDEKKNDDKAD